MRSASTGACLHGPWQPVLEIGKPTSRLRRSIAASEVSKPILLQQGCAAQTYKRFSPSKYFSLASPSASSNSCCRRRQTAKIQEMAKLSESRLRPRTFYFDQKAGGVKVLFPSVFQRMCARESSESSSMARNLLRADSCVKESTLCENVGATGRSPLRSDELARPDFLPPLFAAVGSRGPKIHLRADAGEVPAGELGQLARFVLPAPQDFAAVVVGRGTGCLLALPWWRST